MSHPLSAAFSLICQIVAFMLAIVGCAVLGALLVSLLVGDRGKAAEQGPSACVVRP